jgi:hypothetical protein
MSCKYVVIPRRCGQEKEGSGEAFDLPRKIFASGVPKAEKTTLKKVAFFEKFGDSHFHRPDAAEADPCTDTAYDFCKADSE